MNFQQNGLKNTCILEPVLFTMLQLGRVIPTRRREVGMDFLADMLVMNIEQNIEDTPLRQRMVDGLMNLIATDKTEPDDMTDFLQELREDEELYLEDYNQITQAENLLSELVA